MNYKGHCFCNTIQFETRNEPFFSQYCHCQKCRDIAIDSKNPQDKIGYALTTAYLTESFSILQGKENLISVVRNNARLFMCAKCKSLIYGISEDPTKQGGIGVNFNNFQFEATVPVSFKPVRHIWYQNRIIDFEDDLPKFKDAPKEQFGTGELY